MHINKAGQGLSTIRSHLTQPGHLSYSSILFTPVSSLRAKGVKLTSPAPVEAKERMDILRE